MPPPGFSVAQPWPWRECGGRAAPCILGCPCTGGISKCDKQTATVSPYDGDSSLCVVALTHVRLRAIVELAIGELAGDGPDGGERGTPPAVFETM